MPNAEMSPVSIAFWSSVRRCRIRMASWRGISSMSRWAWGVKRVVTVREQPLQGLCSLPQIHQAMAYTNC
ncbi:hypothetical protein SAMN04489712_11217 [Thermomonospora echinospora]|uniref:Uncharacterized protein n=1 Tax=Thermomonospora echinospora TaxID=1992 RepID=A0A1H6D0D0_9ACTN|nr:hypothetical protein SAMN04489712_11217 [Thermomonospora echinospora]